MIVYIFRICKNVENIASILQDAGYIRVFYIIATKNTYNETSPSVVFSVFSIYAYL